MLTAFTGPPATTAPDASVRRPVMRPVATCAASGAVASKLIATTLRNFIRCPFRSQIRQAPRPGAYPMKPVVDVSYSRLRIGSIERGPFVLSAGQIPRRASRGRRNRDTLAFHADETKRVARRLAGSGAGPGAGTRPRAENAGGRGASGQGAGETEVAQAHADQQFVDARRPPVSRQLVRRDSDRQLRLRTDGKEDGRLRAGFQQRHRDVPSGRHRTVRCALLPEHRGGAV